MVNKPIKSQPNMISEEIIMEIFFPFCFLAFWFSCQPITSIASGAIHPHSPLYNMEKGFNRNPK